MKVRVFVDRQPSAIILQGPSHSVHLDLEQQIFFQSFSVFDGVPKISLLLKMSPSNMFNLPIRSAHRQSLIYNHTFQLLYAQNETALNKFLTLKLPLHDAELSANKDFIAYIQEQEQGPTVDYEGLRANMSSLRGSLKRSSVGAEIFDFFKTLFQIRANWTLAAARFHSFDLFVDMVKAVYLDRNDVHLLAVLNLENFSDNTAWRSNSKALSQLEQRNAVNAEWARRQKDLDTISRQLHDIKVSDEMWSTCGKLQEIIELQAKLLAVLREQDAQKRRLEIRKKEQIKMRNTRRIMLQMGMAGTLPVSDNDSAVMEARTNDHKDMFFSFKEDECVAEEYVEDEM